MKNLDLNIYIRGKKAEKGLFRSRKNQWPWLCKDDSRKWIQTKYNEYMNKNTVTTSEAEHVKWGECKLNNPTLAAIRVH